MSEPQPTQEGAAEFVRRLKQQRKPLSPRRARELRDRYLKRVFGTRKQRAERFAWLTNEYGYDTAVHLSRSRMPVEGCTCFNCARMLEVKRS